MAGNIVNQRLQEITGNHTESHRVTPFIPLWTEQNGSPCTYEVWVGFAACSCRFRPFMTLCLCTFWHLRVTHPLPESHFCRDSQEQRKAANSLRSLGIAAVCLRASNSLSLISRCRPQRRFGCLSSSGGSQTGYKR